VVVALAVPFLTCSIEAEGPARAAPTIVVLSARAATVVKMRDDGGSSSTLSPMG